MTRLNQLKTNYYRVPKGIREYQGLVNYFLSLDNKRGKGYRKLAKEYNLPVWSIRDRIKTWNKKYHLELE